MVCEEVVVGALDSAVHAELDDRHGAFDGLDQRLLASRFGDLLGDIGGELDHLADPAAAVEHRVVGGFQPDVAAALVAALDGAAEKFATAQTIPEGCVIAAGGEILGAQQPMRLADQFKGGVAHRVAEVVIDGEHLAIEAQFDDGGGPFERGAYRTGGGQFSIQCRYFCFKALVAKHASLLLGRVANYTAIYSFYNFSYFCSVGQLALAQSPGAGRGLR